VISTGEIPHATVGRRCEVQWRNQKFRKGRGDDISDPSSFIANAHFIRENAISLKNC